ncbi:VOC family protein [Variovorax sp. CCNWLW225]|jgi:PhnB protein|uniref:VOC family protein n=1 Tax=unclassified Variovorax TaxID=663243 RepID=UPI000F89C7ED|nr:MULTISPECIES: VOC family protein [unclassified Variovorax]MCR8957053.1 VOC family protein [Variovorax sp. S12S4]RST51670.1 VOC family protein [Variovorax sp. DXTD-1]
MKVQSYLSFEGRCDEAIAFYKKALGAEVVQLMRYSDAPEMPAGEAEAGCAGGMPAADKVMHSVLRIGETELMASDGRCSGQAEFKGIMLALSASTDAEARQWFDALADGGQVMQPLTPTFFSSSFGMLTDRFGIGWMLVVDSQK